MPPKRTPKANTAVSSSLDPSALAPLASTSTAAQGARTRSRAQVIQDAGAPVALPQPISAKANKKAMRPTIADKNAATAAQAIQEAGALAVAESQGVVIDEGQNADTRLRALRVTVDAPGTPASKLAEASQQASIQTPSRFLVAPPPASTRTKDKVLVPTSTIDGASLPTSSNVNAVASPQHASPQADSPATPPQREPTPLDSRHHSVGSDSAFEDADLRLHSGFNPPDSTPTRVQGDVQIDVFSSLNDFNDPKAPSIPLTVRTDSITRDIAGNYICLLSDVIPKASAFESPLKGSQSKLWRVGPGRQLVPLGRGDAVASSNPLSSDLFKNVSLNRHVVIATQDALGQKVYTGIKVFIEDKSKDAARNNLMAYFNRDHRDRVASSPSSSSPSVIPEVSGMLSLPSRSPSLDAPSSPLSAVTPRPRPRPANITWPEEIPHADRGSQGSAIGSAQHSTTPTIQQSGSMSSVADQSNDAHTGAEIAQGIVAFVREHFVPTGTRLPGYVKPTLARQALDRWRNVQRVRSTVQEDWGSTVPDEQEAPDHIVGKFIKVDHIGEALGFTPGSTTFVQLGNRWTDEAIGDAPTVLAWVENPDAKDPITNKPLYDDLNRRVTFNGLKTVIENDRKRVYKHGLYPEEEQLRGFTPPPYRHHEAQRMQRDDPRDRNRAGPSYDRHHGYPERR